MWTSPTGAAKTPQGALEPLPDPSRGSTRWKLLWSLVDLKIGVCKPLKSSAIWFSPVILEQKWLQVKLESRPKLPHSSLEQLSLLLLHILLLEVGSVFLVSPSSPPLSLTSQDTPSSLSFPLPIKIVTLVTIACYQVMECRYLFAWVQHTHTHTRVSDKPGNLWSPSYTRPLRATFLTRACTTLFAHLLLWMKEGQGWLHGCVICAVAQGPTFRRALHLFQCSAVAIFKFLILLEQVTLHFYFALGTTNYVTGLKKGLNVLRHDAPVPYSWGNSSTC